jgi:hypothetical protein
MKVCQGREKSIMESICEGSALEVLSRKRVLGGLSDEKIL